MSRFTGKQAKGAARLAKEARRIAAEVRNEDAAPENRKAFRLGPVPQGGRTARSIRVWQEAQTQV